MELILPCSEGKRNEATYKSNVYPSSSVARTGFKIFCALSFSTRKDSVDTLFPFFFRWTISDYVGIITSPKTHPVICIIILKSDGFILS